jgi:hypothetical protein
MILGASRIVGRYYNLENRFILDLPDGHLTAYGNRLVAEDINRALSRKFDRALK